MYRFFLTYISNNKTLVYLGSIVFSVNIILCLFIRLSTASNEIAPQLLNGNDAKGYYAYLPWLVHQKNINEENGYSYAINEQRILKYPYGTALCQLPFYAVSIPFVSHTLDLEHLSRKENLVIGLASSVYIALALMLLFKLLSLFFEDTKSKLLAIAIIYAATNVLYYSVIENGMSHIYSFFSITGFLYTLFSFYKYQRKKHVYWMMFFLFLIVAIRPFNAIVALIVLFFITYQLKQFKLLIYAFITIVSSYLVQILLWKWQCGQWILSSYQGEGFNWLKPHIIDVLFSFRKGLLIYTPVLVLVIIGFAKAFRTHKLLMVISITTCLFFIFLIACWWHWPFGDSFGHRAFIDIYAFAGIGIASFITYTTSKIMKGVGLFYAIACFVLNIIQTWQVKQGIITVDYMNANKYAYQFLYVDDASRNLLGGMNDIFPYASKYSMQRDSINLIDMDFKEFSEPITFSSAQKNTGTYLEIEFDKIELEPFESMKARVYAQIIDSNKTVKTFTAFLLNEIPDDYKTINTKNFKYQIIMPELKEHQQLQVFINNPMREHFDIKNFRANCYFIEK